MTLWIAYGLSILFAALASLADLTTIFLGGASYRYQFSTIFRVALTSATDAQVGTQESDGFGRDPLLKHLKNARVDIGGERGLGTENIEGIAVREEGRSKDKNGCSSTTQEREQTEPERPNVRDIETGEAASDSHEAGEIVEDVEKKAEADMREHTTLETETVGPEERASILVSPVS